MSLPDPALAPAPDSESPSPSRVHLTGAARAEGYYKISHEEKSAYVAQYATRGAAAESNKSPVQQPKPAMTSLRSNNISAKCKCEP